MPALSLKRPWPCSRPDPRFTNSWLPSRRRTASGKKRAAPARKPKLGGDITHQINYGFLGDIIAEGGRYEKSKKILEKIEPPYEMSSPEVIPAAIPTPFIEHPSTKVTQKKALISIPQTGIPPQSQTNKIIKCSLSNWAGKSRRRIPKKYQNLHRSGCGLRPEKSAWEGARRIFPGLDH